MTNVHSMIFSPVPILLRVPQPPNCPLNKDASQRLIYKAPFVAGIGQKMRSKSSLGSNGKEGKGQPIKLLTNHYQIKTNDNWNLYYYKVEFSPDEDKIMVQRDLLTPHINRLRTYAFDGTMIYTCVKYEFNKFSLISRRASDCQMIVITISFISIVEPSDYKYTQVLDSLLGDCQRELELKMINNNYYDPNAEIDISKFKLKLYPGYNTTIDNFEGGLFLRADISINIFHDDTILDFLKECYNKNNNNVDRMSQFRAGIIGSTVMTTYNNEIYTIFDVDRNKNTNSVFIQCDGSEISYADYYKQKWNLHINSKQPMLISKIKIPFTRCNDLEYFVYLVPQFCTIIGINETIRQNTELTKYTQDDPIQTVYKLNDFVGRLITSTKSLEKFQSWGLTLDNNPITIQGHIIQNPTLICGYGHYNGGRYADWTQHLNSSKMFNCIQLEHWVIITPNKYINEVVEFSKKLIKVSKNMSFFISNPQIVKLKNDYIVTYLSTIEKIIIKLKPAFILCILNVEEDDKYNFIRQKLCVERAVPSLVLVMENIIDNNISECTRIAVQINCKIGGAPWSINVSVQGMLIIGLTTYKEKNLNFCAIVATTNESHTKFFSSILPFKETMELAQKIGLLTLKAIMKYKKVNYGEKPNQIVIYRTSVEDKNEFAIYKLELNHIKNVLNEVFSKLPPFAYIITNIINHTKFFINPNYGGGNPPPGTVIDSIVTNPSLYDFFLISVNLDHTLVFPTHYIIIEDTLLDWSPNSMQEFTYKLCHLYYNSSSTTQIPGLCVMAYKLAVFTTKVLKTLPNTALDESLYYL